MTTQNEYNNNNKKEERNQLASPQFNPPTINESSLLLLSFIVDNDAFCSDRNAAVATINQFQQPGEENCSPPAACK